jgi:hypothetical protein
MASKKLQLKQDIEIRWKITIIAKEVYKFSNYFVNPNTDGERNYVSNHRHLNFISWALWRLSVIELCKLFGDSEKQNYNLQKLLKKMAPDGHYRALTFDNDKLNDFNNKLKGFDDSIREINRLRNNFYAHTDKDPFEKIETTLRTSDCANLIVFAEEVLQGLAEVVGNEQYLFNTNVYDSQEFNFIKILSDL